MKLTLIDISWSSASPTTELPREPSASNEYLECLPYDKRALTHLRSDALALTLLQRTLSGQKSICRDAPPE